MIVKSFSAIPEIHSVVAETLLAIAESVSGINNFSSAKAELFSAVAKNNSAIQKFILELSFNLAFQLRFADLYFDD